MLSTEAPVNSNNQRLISLTKLYNRCLEMSIQKENGNKSEVQMIHFKKIQC